MHVIDAPDKPFRLIGSFGAILLFVLAPTPLRAQLLGLGSGVPSASTVRQNEFRSRWADYQVDRRPPQNASQESETTTETPTGFLDLFSHWFNDHFRNGPLQLRADFSAGYEFTDEESLRIQNPHGAETSPFLSPSIGVFYNRELGPATVSARYSAGYVFYLDQSYLAANHNGGILSQTAGLDVGIEGGRTNISSSTSASYGNGNDIESGTSRDLLSISEGVNGVYTLTDFTQLGASGSLSYQSYTGGGNGTDTDTTFFSGNIYGDYLITGKTRLRLEFGAGDQRQGTGDGSTSDRSYYQGLLHINYIPTPKLTLDGGLGYGFQQDSGVSGARGDKSHPVYTFTVNYVPTAKTSVALHFGYEGVDVDPDLSLQVQYQPRPNTAIALSVYQNSGFSTFQISQNLVTRGVLASVQQSFFEKFSVTLASGAEQSKGYASVGSSSGSEFEDPYYFGSISFVWQFSSSLALQSYYRGYTGQFGGSANDKGLQSRASISLRLTF